ncbi:hypothetical protein N9I68_02460 [Bacteroidia bacterium]|nr:hypothetical protein [Bacteroidia bacterium]
MGNSSTNKTSPSDVRSNEIKVTFASHINIKSSDFNVEYNSGNSASELFESTAIIFLKPDITTYGTSTYNGYYGSGTNSVGVSCGTSLSASSSIFSNSTSGVFVAASSGAVNTSSDVCNPTSGKNGSAK